MKIISLLKKLLILKKKFFFFYYIKIFNRNQKKFFSQTKILKISKVLFNLK
jgi:hypothetical protein